MHETLVVCIYERRILPSHTPTSTALIQHVSRGIKSRDHSRTVNAPPPLTDASDRGLTSFRIPPSRCVDRSTSRADPPAWRRCAAQIWTASNGRGRHGAQRRHTERGRAQGVKLFTTLGPGVRPRPRRRARGARRSGGVAGRLEEAVSGLWRRRWRRRRRWRVRESERRGAAESNGAEPQR